jgi:hypothetical protein
MAIDFGCFLFLALLVVVFGFTWAGGLVGAGIIIVVGSILLLIGKFVVDVFQDLPYDTILAILAFFALIGIVIWMSISNLIQQIGL